jgi:site-specific recombinase XerD
MCQLTARHAGLPPCHPHKLRHTYATLLHDAGVDLLEISKLLGHSSIATTQIYTTTSAAGLQAAVARMPDLTGTKGTENENTTRA